MPYSGAITLSREIEDDILGRGTLRHDNSFFFFFSRRDDELDTIRLFVPVLFLTVKRCWQEPPVQYAVADLS